MLCFYWYKVQHLVKRTCVSRNQNSCYLWKLLPLERRRTKKPGKLEIVLMWVAVALYIHVKLNWTVCLRCVYFTTLGTAWWKIKLKTSLKNPYIYDLFPPACPIRVRTFICFFAATYSVPRMHLWCGRCLMVNEDCINEHVVAKFSFWNSTLG